MTQQLFALLLVWNVFLRFRTRILDRVQLLTNRATVTCTAFLAATVSVIGAEEYESLLLENVDVISMESETIRDNKDVLVVDGLIVSIEDHPNVAVPSSIQRIDGTDMFLMPGLIDSHVHIWKDAAARINDKFAAQRLLVHGITRARVAFGEAEILPWRDAVENGDSAGARLIVASPYITTSIETEDFILSNPNKVEVREAIRQFAVDGYDYVKVVRVDDQETLDAILSEATAQQLPVFGHYPNPNFPLDSVVKSSWVSIEHFDILVDLLRKKLGADYDIGRVVSHLNKTGAAVTTVGILFEDEIVADSEIGMDLRQFVSLGGILLAGTEGNFGPGGLGNTLHLELEKLASLGLSPYEVIQTATVNAGPFLEKNDKVGLIKVGYAADLILLSENPLNNVAALRSLGGIAVSGRWYSKDELEDIRHRLPMIE